MSNTKKVRQEVEKQIKNCSIKKRNFKKFFKLMKRQQKHYDIQQFVGNGSFAIVLKATNKNSAQTVALKVVECDENNEKGMEAIQEEQKMVEIFNGSRYIVKVFNNFYLTEIDDPDSDEEEDDNQIPVGQKSNQSEQQKVFYVIEQELCQIGDISITGTSIQEIKILIHSIIDSLIFENLLTFQATSPSKSILISNTPFYDYA
ncbi:hypothetical protein ABPG74_002635 [Tetrahymena malaccensis]